jgi:hypothetical protein
MLPSRVAAVLPYQLSAIGADIGQVRSDLKELTTMTLRISQYTDQNTEAAVVKIEGSLTISGIELLEQTWSELRKETGGPIPLDVERVTFIDEESARIIKQMVHDKRIILRGCRLFTQEIIQGCEPDC